MELFPKFSPRRRVLKTIRDHILHGPALARRLGRTNLFLVRQFEGMTMRCNICGLDSRIRFDLLDAAKMREHRVGLLRENLFCCSCHFTMRQRVLAHALLLECREAFGIEEESIAGLAPKFDAIDVLDTDTFGALARHLRERPGYRVSSYVPDAGDFLEDGRTHNIDLQEIRFDSERFDIIISSDVMEHVRSFDAACREIYRCLKPGGAHIFTVPFDDASASTRILVDTSSDEDVDLDVPQVHGDSLTDGVKAYRIFGVDLLDQLRKHGFDASLRRVRSHGNGIFEGSYFLARRPCR